MIKVSTGLVKKVMSSHAGYQEVLLEVEEKETRGISYPVLVGEVQEGDLVVVNTTAVDLGLGSGGSHFIMGILFKDIRLKRELGHIIKLRYTPYQFATSCLEEEDNPHRSKIINFQSLKETPVIIGEMHSQVAPVSCVIKSKSRGKARIVYIMSDKAALPLSLSNLVHQLKTKGLIDYTITYGQAFGGDYETVNLYTALIAAKEVAEGDIIIITQGVGSVGTNTKYGFSGIEQGEIINAVNIFGGTPIVIPRISFADTRKRHQGISHHTLTVLEIALTPAWVPLPKIEEDKLKKLLAQLQIEGIEEKHLIQIIDADETLSALSEYKIEPTTMGRSLDEDKEFFLAAGASGIFAYQLGISKRYVNIKNQISK